MPKHTNRFAHIFSRLTLINLAHSNPNHSLSFVLAFILEAEFRVSGAFSESANVTCYFRSGTILVVRVHGIIVMSDGKPWTDKERLEQLYCDERMSVADMGEVFGCHGSTVHKYIQRYGIERDEPWKEKGWLQEHWVEKGKTTYEMAEDLPVGPLAIQQQLNNYGIEKPWKDKATLKQMYVEDQMSSSEIAQQLKCSPTTVLDWLHKHNIPVRDLDEAAKIANIQIPLWFGMTANGYERVDTQYDNEKDSVLHHRLLAVAKYGFDALEGKIVHHKNGVKWDNRFENIELVTRADHARIHKPRSKS